MKVEYDKKWVVRCWVQNMVDCIETCYTLKDQDTLHGDMLCNSKDHLQGASCKLHTQIIYVARLLTKS